MFVDASARAIRSDRKGAGPEEKEELATIIFDIQRFSVSDGPGIRTTVFMKGCPLRCPWCHNPESQHPFPEVMFFESKCIGCGRCREACPRGAISPDPSLCVDRRLCDNCGKCAQACPSNALVLSGTLMTVSDVMRQVEKDAPFYKASGGGVTLSGGEPTMHPEFAAALASFCRERGLHVALDTCGFAARGTFARLIEHVDLVLFDVKHTNPERHKNLTGADAEPIIDNLYEVAERGVATVIRVPVIPGCNDTTDNVHKLAHLVRQLLDLGGNITCIDLLPYHRLGEAKYKALGRPYSLGGIQTSDRAWIEELRSTLSEAQLGIPVLVSTA